MLNILMHAGMLSRSEWCDVPCLRCSIRLCLCENGSIALDIGLSPESEV